MAEAGTDIVLVLSPGQILTAPVDMNLLGGAASLATAGTTASTLVVNHNGTAMALNFSFAAGATATPEQSQTIASSLIPVGDNITITPTYGTAAAGGAVSLWCQRQV